MRPPSPRVCLTVSVMTAAGFAGWDGFCMTHHSPLPPPQLHSLAGAVMVVGAITGLLQLWFEHLIDVGGRLERARCSECHERDYGRVRPDLELVSGEVRVRPHIRPGMPRPRPRRRHD